MKQRISLIVLTHCILSSGNKYKGHQLNFCCRIWGLWICLVWSFDLQLSPQALSKFIVSLKPRIYRLSPASQTRCKKKHFCFFPIHDHKIWTWNMIIIFFPQGYGYQMFYFNFWSPASATFCFSITTDKWTIGTTSQIMNVPPSKVFNHANEL